MTKTQAIAKSILIWQDLLDGSNKPSELFKLYYNGCPLCEYVVRRLKKTVLDNDDIPGDNDFCEDYCPYAIHMGHKCVSTKSPYLAWETMRLAPREPHLDQRRKDLALEFLNELREILVKEVLKND